MKKKVFLIIGGAVFAIAVVFNISISFRGDSLSDFTLANVEALANGEVIAGPLCVYVPQWRCGWPPVPEDPYWFWTDGKF